MIQYKDFQKLKLKVATIISAETIPDSNKLLKLKVDIGTEIRQIIAGIKQHYQVDQLIGTQIIIISNLEYRQIMGHESQGMLLAADSENKPVILKPTEVVNPGTPIR